MRLFTDVASTISDPFMRRAFVLAENARALTSPNPIVGCVLVQDDEIVGEGWHARAGDSHAEVMALRMAGPRAAGATAYVTLEPCNHEGRTPACSETLISRGVAGVVVGMGDPNPVAVGGSVRLREAGVEVEFESDPTPFEIQNEAWLHFVRTGRPFVQVKIALSLDGHATISPGHRASITGEGGRAITMKLRSWADAIMVGASTTRIDDPSLLVRDINGTVLARQPDRIVIGRSQVPDATLFRDGLGKAAALLPDGFEAPRGVSVIHYPVDRGLVGALEILGQQGVVRLMVEAGPGLLEALWDDDLIDELVLVHAGGMAGPQAPAIFSRIPGSIEGLSCEMVPLETGISGEDAVSVWRPRPGHGQPT